MKNICKRFTTIVLLTLSGAVVSDSDAADANGKPRSMTPVDMLNIARIGSPRISPDGENVVFVRRTTNWEENRQVRDLWLVNLKTRVERQLTFDTVTERSPRWSADGNYISFIAKRGKDKHRRIYLLPMAGGEAYPVGDHQADISVYKWSKDSGSIYFLANEPLSEEVLEKRKSKDDMVPFEEAQTLRAVWKLDLKSESIARISPQDAYVRSFALSPDSSLIAYSMGPGTVANDSYKNDIWLSTASGENLRRITDNDYAERQIQISPDNRRILFIADVNANGDYYYETNLFVVPAAGGTPEILLEDQPFEIEGASWSKSPQWIYTRVNMGVRSELWRVNIKNGQRRQMTDGKHVVGNWSYDPLSHRHVLVRGTSTNPGDIWVIRGDGGKLQRVTDAYGHIRENFRVPEQKLVRWKASDGTDLEGLLSLPLDYKPGQRYPLVVKTHGGPRSSEQYGQFSWSSYIPVMAAMGYAYFSVNHRGGTGYGDAFVRDMVGGYFNNAHLDVMSGVDFLIDEGIADPDSLIKMGWSAGGHMTNKLITFTDRFKAASSGAGAVDWVSMYGESDWRYNRTPWFGGAPWVEDAPLDTYREHSPLKDMWKVKTPTLIFVGEQDKRVPPTQSMMLFRALRDLGVETKLYIAKREEHGFRELRHRLFKINAELDWFGRHLGRAAYEWQRPPAKE